MLIYRGYTIYRLADGTFTWTPKSLSAPQKARYVDTEHQAMNAIDAYLRQLREQIDG